MKFIVQSEKKMVICILENTKFDAREFIDDFKNGDPTCLTNYIYDRKLVTMPNKFIGIAKCADEDEFDEEFGKRLAFHRAKEKRDKCLFKILQKVIDRVNQELEDFVAYADKYGEHLSKQMRYREEKIKKHLGVNNNE